MTLYEPGEVVVVRFPFTNHEGVKQRPAVVVSSKSYNTGRPDVILIAVTSQTQPPLGWGDAEVKDWQDAGLLKPSLFKPVIFTVEQSLVRKSLGRITMRDVELGKANPTPYNPPFNG